MGMFSHNDQSHIAKYLHGRGQEAVSGRDVFFCDPNLHATLAR